MEIDPDLLRRYWKQACSEAEKRQVESWLEAGEPDGDYGIGGDLDAKKLQKELWESLAPHPRPSAAPVEKAAFLDQRVPIWRRKIVTVGIAASMALIALLAYVFWGFPEKNTELPLVQYHEILAPYGKKISLTLPDSTIVYLNSGSCLKYPPQFSSKRRYVIIEGEAFFQVTKDPDRPFIAETPRSTTHVLGTRFNLRDFSNEQSSSIMVEEGKVQFTGHGCADTLFLLASDRAVLTGTALRKSTAQVSDYTDWKDNILRFNDIPLGEAIPMIERWYNVHITLDDSSLATLKIKGSFKQRPFRKLMDDFSYLMNLRYRIDEQNVLLYK